MAEPTPNKEARHRLRQSLTRHLLAATAGVAFASALMFLGFGHPLDWVARLSLTTAFLGLGGVAFALRRDAGAGVQGRALPYVIGTAIGLSGVAAAVAGEGLMSPALAVVGVFLCLFTVVSGLRAGILAAAIGAGMLLLLAVAMAFDWLSSAGIVLRDAPLNLVRPLLTHALVLGIALGGGELLGRTLDRTLRSADERERRFLGLLAVAADAYWEMDGNGRLIRFSAKEELRNFVGLRRHGVDAGMGKLLWETRGVLFDAQVLDAFRSELAAKLPMRDVPLRWSDVGGRVRHFTLSAEPRTNESGKFAGYWGVLRDITQDVKARQALWSTETRYQDLFRRIPTPLLLHREGRVLDANPAGVALFGFTDLRALLGQDLVTLFEAGPTRARASEHLQRLEALATGEGLPETEFTLMPGVDRRLTVRVSSVRVDVDGEAATLSIITDDTERRGAEDLVRRSETLLSHLVSTSPDWITLTEFASGRYAMVNPTFLATTGYRADEVIGRTPSELGLWADATQRDRIYRMLDQQQAVQNFPATMITRDRRRVSMLVSAARFTIDDIDYQMTSARDVTASEQARREREAILENALVGISFTRDKRIVMTNARFDEMFGWPRGALQNQQQRVVWPSDESFDAMSEEIGPALSRGDSVDLEVAMMRRDGSTFTGRLLAKALDPAQPTSGTIWLAEDVTERRVVEQALARARDEAEAANRAKSAFLANTSHEILTPLNALVGLAQLARTPEVDDRRRLQYIEQICESADTLSAILSDILDLSKIEAGKLIVDRVAFDLHGLIGTLRQAYGALADTKGLALVVHIDDDVPQHVQGDPMRLRQVLTNYLTNALKFTTAGSIVMNVQRGVGFRLRFEVVDTGAGMDGAGLARLFLPFSQVDNSITRKVGGTGLGLSICSELARLMDGTVGVNSEPGQGSVFWVDLPLPPVSAQQLEEHESTSGLDALQGTRILMVEDNAVNMMIAVALLERWGAIVDQADDGPSALHAIDHAHQCGNPFDIVLMDVQMPGMSGHDVTRRLRLRYDRHTLPIVALTAAALVSEREDAMAAGMNDFLTKPIDAERLRQTLRQVLMEAEARVER
ncbi:MAG: PAS domain S-box protein [Burkholderiaceae bacterium]